MTTGREPWTPPTSPEWLADSSSTESPDDQGSEPNQGSQDKRDNRYPGRITWTADHRPTLAAALALLAVVLGAVAMIFPVTRMSRQRTDDTLETASWIHGRNSFIVDGQESVTMNSVGLGVFIAVLLAAAICAVIALATRASAMLITAIIATTLMGGVYLHAVVPATLATSAQNFSLGAGYWLGSAAMVLALVAAGVFARDVKRRLR